MGELKEKEALLADLLEQIGEPKSIPPYIFKDENLGKFRKSLVDLFMSKKYAIAKRYLNFILQKIEVIGNEVRLFGNSPALCDLALGNRPQSVNHLGEVPSIGLPWLLE